MQAGLYSSQGNHCSYVSTNLNWKAKAKVKDLTFKEKDLTFKAKGLTFKAKHFTFKAKAKDSTFETKA